MSARLAVTLADAARLAADSFFYAARAVNNATPPDQRDSGPHSTRRVEELASQALDASSLALLRAIEATDPVSPATMHSAAGVAEDAARAALRAMESAARAALMALCYCQSLETLDARRAARVAAHAAECAARVSLRAAGAALDCAPVTRADRARIERERDADRSAQAAWEAQQERALADIADAFEWDAPSEDVTNY